MKTATDLQQRLTQLQAMKASLLMPPILVFSLPGSEPPDLSLEPDLKNYLLETQRVSVSSPTASLESLNAEVGVAQRPDERRRPHGVTAMTPQQTNLSLVAPIVWRLELCRRLQSALDGAPLRIWDDAFVEYRCLCGDWWCVTQSQLRNMPKRDAGDFRCPACMARDRLAPVTPTADSTPGA